MMNKKCKYVKNQKVIMSNKFKFYKTYLLQIVKSLKILKVILLNAIKFPRLGIALKLSEPKLLSFKEK